MTATTDVLSVLMPYLVVLVLSYAVVRFWPSGVKPDSWDAILSTAVLLVISSYVLLGLLFAPEPFQQTVVVVLPALCGMQTFIATRKKWSLNIGKGEQKGEMAGGEE
jgi:hypothetical protein